MTVHNSVRRLNVELKQFQRAVTEKRRDVVSKHQALDQFEGPNSRERQIRTKWDRMIGNDKKEVRHEKKDALHDLKEAQFHLPLKQLNRDRGILGLDKLKKRPESNADQILDTARKFIGLHERGNNGNPFSKALGRPPEAWCADFVSYCAKKAGLKLNTASAQGVADYLKDRGSWKGRHNPQPGDALTFRWDGSGRWADHVGMVEKVFEKHGKKYVQTIEGNSSDQVRRKVYAANDPVINGFGTIK
jgi:hypothetical protein